MWNDEELRDEKQLISMGKFTVKETAVPPKYNVL